MRVVHVQYLHSHKQVDNKHTDTQNNYVNSSFLVGVLHHASTCKRGGDAVFRHNRLRDVVAESCRLAHLSVKVEAGNNLTPDHSHTRSADVLVQNWSRGRPAAFDICVTSPHNTLPLSEAGVYAGAAA